MEVQKMKDTKTVLNSVFGRFKKKDQKLGLLPGEVKTVTEYLRNSVIGLKGLVEDKNTEAVFEIIKTISDLNIDFPTVKPNIEKIVSYATQCYLNQQGAGYCR